MIVVADTSPLNYLVLLGHVDVLRILYGRVAIPHAVRDEMLAARAPALVKAWAADLPMWMELISALRIDPTLPEILGDGEREAISLAMELKADLVLVDDLPARIAVEKRGFVATGCLTVLLDASRRGYLDFGKSLDKLKSLGFRMSPALEETFRELAGVKRS